MRKSILPISAAVAGIAILAAFAATAQTPSETENQGDGQLIVLDDIIGRVQIETRPSAKLSIDVQDSAVVKAGKMPKLKVEEQNNSIVVMSDEELKLEKCNTKNNKRYIQIKGDKLRPLDDFPLIKITASDTADLKIKFRGGVLDAGNVDDASLMTVGCGDMNIGDVKGDLKVAIKGSGDVTAQDVGELFVMISGSGDVKVQDVSREAEATIQGSGDISMGNVGSTISAVIKGSGDITAGKVTGDVEAIIKGSGDIKVDGDYRQNANLIIMGSGDMNIGGEVGDLMVSIKGSGDVKVGKLRGELQGGIYGSGDLTIDGRVIEYKKGQWQY